jgi:hypothetical protein
MDAAGRLPPDGFEAADELAQSFIWEAGEWRELGTLFGKEFLTVVTDPVNIILGLGEVPEIKRRYGGAGSVRFIVQQQ